MDTLLDGAFGASFDTVDPLGMILRTLLALLADSLSTVITSLYSGLFEITTIDLSTAAVRNIWAITTGISASLATILLVIAAFRSMVAQSNRYLLEALPGVVLAILGPQFITAFLPWLAAASTDLAQAIVASATPDLAASMRLLAGVGNNPFYEGLGLMAPVVAAMLLFGMSMVFFVLLFCMAGAVVLYVLSPFAFAGLVMAPTRAWFTKWATGMFAVVFAKVPIAILLALSVSLFANSAHERHGAELRQRRRWPDPRSRGPAVPAARVRPVLLHGGRRDPAAGTQPSNPRRPWAAPTTAPRWAAPGSTAPSPSPADSSASSRTRPPAPPRPDSRDPDPAGATRRPRLRRPRPQDPPTPATPSTPASPSTSPGPVPAPMGGAPGRGSVDDRGQPALRVRSRAPQLGPPAGRRRGAGRSRRDRGCRRARRPRACGHDRRGRRRGGPQVRAHLQARRDALRRSRRPPPSSGRSGTVRASPHRHLSTRPPDPPRRGSPT